jgi:hypothetical protein
MNPRPTTKRPYKRFSLDTLQEFVSIVPNHDQDSASQNRCFGDFLVVWVLVHGAKPNSLDCARVSPLSYERGVSSAGLASANG